MLNRPRRWFRYRSGALSARNPRWAALDNQLRTGEHQPVTDTPPQGTVVQVNPVTPWWTHPAPGAERVALQVDCTEHRPLPAEICNQAKETTS